MTDILGTKGRSVDITLLKSEIETNSNFKRASERKALWEILEHAQKSCSSEHPTRPGKFSDEISDTGEKAMQRAIYDAGTTELDDNTIHWAGIELPVLLTKKRRKMCVDLIGLIDDKPHIVELKYCPTNAKSPTSNSPLYGIFEVLIYYLIVKYCTAEALDIHSHRDSDRAKFKWTEIGRKLFVAANFSYWNIWLDPKYKIQNLQSHITKLNGQYDVDIRLFSMRDETFAHIAGTKYKPKTRNVPWVQLDPWEY